MLPDNAALFDPADRRCVKGDAMSGAGQIILVVEEDLARDFGVLFPCLHNCCVLSMAGSGIGEEKYDPW